MYFQEIEDRCKREVESLRQKLKWYAENQQLLDKDAIMMKQKDEEIARLKSKLDDLSTDVSINRNKSTHKLRMLGPT